MLPTAPRRAAPAGARGSETVLLVEDEPSVRAVAREALGDHGYRVIEAQHGVEALAVAERARGRRIDLLVTDMVMPQMGGRELAQRLRRSGPAMRVLFMSGYTDDVIVRRGVSRPPRAFLQKPFAMVPSHARCARRSTPCRPTPGRRRRRRARGRRRLSGGARSSTRADQSREPFGRRGAARCGCQQVARHRRLLAPAQPRAVVDAFQHLGQLPPACRRARSGMLKNIARFRRCASVSQPAATGAGRGR